MIGLGTSESADCPRSAAIFQEAVDPIALGIPSYFDIVPQEDARDLSLIKRKLDNDEYSSFEAFEEDFLLMINNCLVFNGEGSYAYDVGLILQGELERELDRVRSQFVGGSATSTNKQLKRSSTSGPGAPGGGIIKKIKFNTSQSHY